MEACFSRHFDGGISPAGEFGTASAMRLDAERDRIRVLFLRGAHKACEELFPEESQRGPLQ